jgi:hypothetical protein
MHYVVSLWKSRKVLPTKVEENICDDDDHHQAVSFCPFHQAVSTKKLQN